MDDYKLQIHTCLLRLSLRAWAAHGATTSVIRFHSVFDRRILLVILRVSCPLVTVNKLGMIINMTPG